MNYRQHAHQNAYTVHSRQSVQQVTVCVKPYVCAHVVIHVQDKYAAGSGTYARGGYIHASIVGMQQTSSTDVQVRAGWLQQQRCDAGLILA